MSARTWQDGTELPPATTWLLEASAGTGKTFQIAGLFVRLVAEYDLPAERILAITFTNAATAELRDRVRARLRDALAMLRAPDEKSDDPIVAHLRALDRRDEHEKRLELALRAFDLAPISTIHGFSQRMLKELAFDSGQDAKLELLSDPSEVLEQIVDDALARSFAGATPIEAALYEAAGFRRDALRSVARAMSGASEPAVSPTGAADLQDERARAAARAEAIDGVRRRWSDDAGREALDALVADLRSKALSGNVSHWEGSLRKVRDWLAEPTPIDLDEPWCKRLRVDAVRTSWKRSEEALRARPWWPLLVALDEAFATDAAFWRSFAPVAAFARSVRGRVEEELGRRRALTYDAMLSRLAERIARDGGASSPLAARIRERFDAVFVDEFQDTDAAQWRVIEAAFHGHRRLFLIGDPKQAIYAFRGADVHVYLEAARAVDDERRRTMAFNWRSDPQAVAAMNALFRADSGAFDEAEIDYVRVSPKKPARLAPPGAGLEIRWVDDRVSGGAAGVAVSRKIEGRVAELAAREAVAWLRGDRARISLGGDATRDVEPADLAVLVNSHYEARAARQALARVGVPSVAASRGSVFDTLVAQWLVAWLRAVDGAGRDREARLAVVTPLFGWTGDELAWALAIASRGDAARAEAAAKGIAPRDWNAWTDRLRAAAGAFAKWGFARTFDREAVECGVHARVLAMPDGERHATDLRHLFELLHVEERTRRGSPGVLADWLAAQAGTESDEAAQRLESDARAVTIETVHASKGLEYPIVLLPFGWSARAERDAGAPFLLRTEAGSELHLEPRGSDARTKAHARLCEEQRREGLRKLYVALTRAKHRTIAWYGPIGDEGARTSATPLGRLLMRDPSRRGFDDATMPVFEAGSTDAWAPARARLDALAAHAEGAIAWTAEPVEPEPASWAPVEAARAPLGIAPWPAERGPLSDGWVVTSYSGLAAGSAAHDRDEELVVDASLVVEGDRDAGRVRDGGIAAVKPPLVAFEERPRLSSGGGKVFGTWVHGVLEQLDFATGGAKDGRSADALVRAEGDRLGLGAPRELGDDLVRQLPRWLDTPLGSTRDDDAVRGLPAGFTLRELARADRLDELAFDLRLGDGAAFRREAVSARPAGRLDPRPGCADPGRVYDAILSAGALGVRALSPWFAHLRARRDAGEALIGSVAGILTGSIDLVFRVRDGAGARYFLADYKTNRIEASAPGHYAGAWLDWEMTVTGYPLQALIYTLALHRHLRVRLRDYDYDAHVGGYMYLFLRGMSGADTPRDPASGRCLGVFGDRWPREVVEALDAALWPREVAR